MSTPSLDDQVAALGIAYIEMAKMLGKAQRLSVMQLATAIENEAKAKKSSAGAEAAVAELARRLRS